MSGRAPHGHEPFADENAGSAYFATAPHCARLADGVYNHLANTRGIALVSGRLLPRAAILFNHFPSLAGHSTILDCPSGATFGDLMNLYAVSLETRARFDDDGRQWPTASAQLPPSGALAILVLENADRLSDEGLVELNRSYTDASRPLVVLTGADGFFRRLERAAVDLVGSGCFAHFPVEHLAPGEVAAFIDYQIGAAESGAAVFRPEIIDLISAYADGDPVTVNRLARRILNLARPPAEDPIGSLSEAARVGVVDAGPTAVPGANEAAYPLADTAQTNDVLDAALERDPSALIVADLVTTMAPPPGSTEPDLPASAQPLGIAPLLVSIEAEAGPLHTRDAGESGEGRAAAATEIIGDLLPEDASSEIRWPNDIEPAAVGTLTPDALAPVEGEAVDADDLGARALDVDDSPALAAEGSKGALVSQTSSGTPGDEGLDDEGNDVPSVPDPARPSYPVSAHRGGRLVGWIAACLAVLMVSGGALRYVLDTQRPQSAAQAANVSVSVQESLDLRPIPVAQTLDKPTDPPPAIAAAPSAPPVAAVPKELEQPVTGSGTTAPQESKSPKPLDKSESPARPIETIEAAQPQPLPAEPTKTDVKPKPTTPPRESVAMVEPPATVEPADPAPELAKPEARPAAAAAGADEIALLLQRGDQLLSTGDIASARRFFERAADQGDGAAATRLAKTYDPLYLQQSGVRGMFGDPAKAVTWYHRGISAGDLEADIRLLQLRAKFPE